MLLLDILNVRAALFGLYLSFAIASKTRALVSSLTPSLFDETLETVAIETLASFATSCIFTNFLIPSFAYKVYL